MDSERKPQLLVDWGKKLVGPTTVTNEVRLNERSPKVGFLDNQWVGMAFYCNQVARLSKNWNVW